MKKQREWLGYIIAILIILIVSFNIQTNKTVNQIEETNTDTTERINDQTKKRTTGGEILIYKEILGNNQSANFTGIEERNDSTFAYALQIKSRDSSSFDFRIERLINWKSKDDIKGIATLDISSIRSDNWNIEDYDGSLKPAFRFLEDKENCQIEILISKRNYREPISIVKEICKGKTRNLTMRMNYK